MAQSMRLLVSIVERGHGVTMQKLYTARHVFLHLQCAGRGTATSEIMDILGLGSSEKDVVLSFASAATCRALLQELDGDLRGSTGTTGIVFSLPVSALNNLAAALVLFKAGESKRIGGDTAMNHSEENTLILVACSRGYTDAVMATAKAQGARGGTVIKARLAGLEELEQAYDLDHLTADREIVAIVVPTSLRTSILEAINTAHGLRSPAQSVLCSLPIEEIVRLG